MNYKAIIGLEIHMQLKSKSKLFSDAPTSFGKAPNSYVAALDMAFPGTMPILNKECVVSAIKMADALHMEICKKISFDRKNYFYSDLPKGYQLTQHFHPFGKNGYLITKNGFKVDINHIHLEEDACKQIHLNDVTLVDYNRAGMGLIEIVTEPVIPNGLEASLFLEEINRIATSLDVTSGKLQEGALRCDVNVSIYDNDKQFNYPVVELKNLNGFKNVGRAIDSEVNRQIELLNNGLTVKAETRRYDEAANQTVFMRNKNKQLDYKYFADANIVPIVLTDEFVQSVISNESKNNDLDRYEITIEDKDILSKDITLLNQFRELVSKGVSTKTAVNWTISRINAIKKKYSNFEINNDDLSHILMKVDKGELDNRQATLVIEKILLNDLSVDDAVVHLGFNVSFNQDKLTQIIDEILLEYPQAVNDYKQGKDKAFNYLLGCINQRCKGQASQKEIKSILLNKLGGQ